jgi:urease accessory protein
MAMGIPIMGIPIMGIPFMGTTLMNKAHKDLYHLLHLSDSLLPIGAFTQSYGLETYVQKGLLHDGSSALDYIQQAVRSRMLYNDFLPMKLAYEYTEQEDLINLKQLDTLLTVSNIPRECREGSIKLCSRLLKIVGLFESLEDSDLLASYRESIASKEVFGHYAIGFGLSGCLLGISKNQLLTAFIFNGVSAMVNNCVKLIPLGQLEGQKLLHTMTHGVDDLINQLEVLERSDVGMCFPGFELRAIQHEQLYSRLYMS